MVLDNGVSWSAAVLVDINNKAFCDRQKWGRVWDLKSDLNFNSGSTTNKQCDFDKLN